MCNFPDCVCTCTPSAPPAHPAAMALLLLPILFFFAYAVSGIFVECYVRKSDSNECKGMVIPRGDTIEGTVAKGWIIPVWTTNNSPVCLVIALHLVVLVALSMALASVIIYSTGVVYALLNGAPFSDSYWSELTQRMTKMGMGIVLAIHFKSQIYR